MDSVKPEFFQPHNRIGEVFEVIPELSKGGGPNGAREATCIKDGCQEPGKRITYLDPRCKITWWVDARGQNYPVPKYIHLDCLKIIDKGMEICLLRNGLKALDDSEELTARQKLKFVSKYIEAIDDWLGRNGAFLEKADNTELIDKFKREEAE